MNRLMEKIVFSGLVTAWRLATWPTRRSLDFVKATTDGVVRPPSAFAITVGESPSMTATTEFVVPRSMPMILLKEPSIANLHLESIIVNNHASDALPKGSAPTHTDGPHLGRLRPPSRYDPPPKGRPMTKSFIRAGMVALIIGVIATAGFFVFLMQGAKPGPHEPGFTAFMLVFSA